MKAKITLILLLILNNSLLGQVRINKLVKDTPIFGYIDPAHTSELNGTRKLAGSPALRRDPRLDSLALSRCLRYGRLVATDTRYITDTGFVKKEIHNDFYGMYKSENATEHLYGAGFPGKDLVKLTSDKVSATINATKYDPGKEYNGSEGHYKNRINKNWKVFGSATVVVYVMVKNPDYDPNTISLEFFPKAIFINYEVFE